ncbi:MAG: tRNA (adenine(22)-N(1))-methyltransferase [Oscillospiraceae bacterium]|jgi:tRNA A22 N-methylase|uniref:tRNA (adenine(22)-N(1))-methyltransferase n=1 Tax=Candidatus Pseudoscillospira sp. SGI.172 TaxID=3420582 RepID=UPI003CFD8973
MKRPFSLSPRLAAVAELVPQGTRLADVGTDHGRLPVWLIQHGVVERAVASDLRPGPLSRARALAERWAVADRISFRLCDGLSGIGSEEARTVTVAGMGGETIAEILAAAPWTGESGHRYILQPMSGLDGLRRYLSGHGFAIRRETLVEEGETLYVVLLAEPGEMPPLTEGEIWVGRQSRGEDGPLRERYLEQELGKLRRAAEGLSRTERAEDQAKRARYEAAAEEVERMREEWRQWQA